MNIDSIQNGYVIDHIKGGKGMEIFVQTKSHERRNYRYDKLRNIAERKHFLSFNSLIQHPKFCPRAFPFLRV